MLFILDKKLVRHKWCPEEKACDTEDKKCHHCFKIRLRKSFSKPNTNECK